MSLFNEKIKLALRRITPPIVWDASKKLLRRVESRKLLAPESKYYGLLELDKKLEQFLDYDNGFFIEIGGWDGVTYSNTLYFERFRNWRGVLIEPAPNEFLACKRNRPNAKVFCFACVPFGYPDKFVSMSYCAAMTCAHSSDSAPSMLENMDQHLESGEKFLSSGQQLFEFGALAKPLTQILSEYEIQSEIDLLVLDVEGFELNVLQGIDFEIHAPKFICVEVRLLEPIKEFLDSKGYRIVSRLTDYGDHQDYLFSRS